MEERVKDSFGVAVEVGDYVLSAATSSGVAKLGTVYAASSGRLMMNVAHSNWGLSSQRSELGYNVLVLRKADGSVPEHVGISRPTVADVEDALRSFMAHQDYDQHKAIERDEETGENRYPEVAAAFYRSLMGDTA